jgi:Cys-tRNA synthase (O-phospho-L-seryl-tRNA:Cys-tRNA synthase)
LAHDWYAAESILEHKNTLGSYHVQHGPTTEQVRAMLDRDPDAKAVMVTSPDYYGVAAHVQGIAAACHFHDVPLVVGLRVSRQRIGCKSTARLSWSSRINAESWPC